MKNPPQNPNQKSLCLQESSIQHFIGGPSSVVRGKRIVLRASKRFAHSQYKPQFSLWYQVIKELGAAIAMCRDQPCSSKTRAVCSPFGSDSIL